MRNIFICFLISLFFISVLSVSSLGIQTTKTIVFHGGYIEQAVAGTPYLKQFNFVSPDGVSELYYVKFKVVGDFQAGTDVYAQLEGQYCIPESYHIYANANRYEAVFDCTGVVAQEGVYEGGFQVMNHDAYNVYAEWIFTYKNNPEVEVEDIYNTIKYSLDFFGTEYKYNERGKAWIQLLADNDSAIEGSSCYLYIYSPDNTEYLHSGMMGELGNGIYYYDMVIPITQGVYPMVSECYLAGDSGQTIETADAVLITQGSEKGGTYNDTQTSDNTRHQILEGLPNPRQIDIEYNFTNFCEPSESQMTGMSIFWEGQWISSPEDVIIYIWNYTDSTWNALPNRIYHSANDILVSNSLTGFNNSTTAGYTDVSGGTVRLRFQDENITDTSDHRFKTDYLYVSCDELGDGRWEMVRGASEIHVSNLGISYIVDMTSVEFMNDSVYGGYGYANFTLDSAVYIDTLTTITHNLPANLPCDMLEWVKRWNSSSSAWEDVDYEVSWDVDKIECVVSIEQLLKKDGVDYYRVKSQNYWMRRVLQRGQRMKSYYRVSNALCNVYFDEMGYSCPSFPLSSLPDSGDVLYDNCVLFWEKYDMANNTYNELVTMTVNSTSSYGNFSTRYATFNEHYERVRYNTEALLFAETLMTLIKIDNSTLAGLNATQIETLQNISYPMLNYLKLHQLNISVDNITFNYDYILDNTTAEISSAETNIIGEVNQTGDNVISTLNVSIYNARDYINSAITTAQNYIISQLNSSIWSAHNSLNTTVWIIHDSIESIIQTSEESIKTNTTLEIDNLESLITGLNNLTASEVWSYGTREITGGNLTVQNWVVVSDLSNLATQDNTTELKNLINSLENLTANGVWSYATRDLTDYNQTGMWIYLENINSSQLADSDVWNYATRTLSNYSGVWSYTTRELTDCNQTDMWIYLEDINVSIENLNGTTPADVWSYASRTLTDYSGVWSVGTRTLTDNNQTQIWLYLDDINTSASSTVPSLINGLNNLSANDVWTYGTRDLTDYNQTDLWIYLAEINSSLLTPYDIWSYATREITGGNLTTMDWVVVNDLSNIATQDNTTELKNILNSLENLTASEVWAYATRDLTDYNQTDVWIYLEDINTSQITNADIWSYATRTLSNYSGIWSYGTRDLTDYNQTDMWIYLEDINTTIDNLNGTTPSDIWSYATREITGGNLTTMDWITVSDLSNLATQDNTTEVINLINSLNNISESDVWSYATRDLTDYNQTGMWIYLGDINSSQLSDSDVWNYATRTLSNYSGVWSYTTRELTDYNQTEMWIYLEDVNETVHGVMLINNTPILEAINDSENRVKVKVEDSEGDVIDEVHDARDDILDAIDGLETNLTLELSYVEGNLSSLIIETENNLTIEIDSAESELLDAIQICCNLTQGILTNMSVNITATCNPKEIWKYLYANPLKTDSEKAIMTGSFVAGASSWTWISILIVICIILTGGYWWRKNR